jgi:Ni2+-binding GTPase involved in maturation of urease and hydrogenase
MPSAFSSSKSADNTALPPQCVVVTGSRGAGKTRWLQNRLRAIREMQPAAVCGVVLVEHGRTRMEDFAANLHGVSLRQPQVRCLCCPAQIDLPGTVRRLVDETPGLSWIFIELPAIAAAALLADFDHAFGWPRQVVVCPGHETTDEPSFFFVNLLALADVVAPLLAPDRASAGRDHSVFVPSLVLT